MLYTCDCLCYGVLFALSCHVYVSTFFFFNDTATTEIYTLSLHDALPIFGDAGIGGPVRPHLEDGRHEVTDDGQRRTENVVMGKGDRRTKRGKIFRGTYGNTRPKKKKKRKAADAAKRAKGEAS